jgi:chaperone BCS1
LEVKKEMQFFNDIYNLLKDNQLLLTGLGLSGAGIITFWLKDVPNKLINLLRRELTTELVLTSRNQIYHDFIFWVDKTYGHKNFRRLKVSNGLWGESRTVTSFGYGVHFITYKHIPLILTLTKESSNQSQYDKDSLNITKIGRSRKIFDEMLSMVTTENIDTSKTKIFNMKDHYWDYIRPINKREINSIFIEDTKKQKVLKALDTFISKEEWYIKNGIPYQIGILLYGPPGTGKTSFIKAIAGYLNYSIYYLPADKLYTINEAVSGLPDKCVLVIEDIDSNNATHSRQVKSKRLKQEEDIQDLLQISSLSDILNALDGLFASHGRILIATTNHIEKLDSALIRPGRIDLQIEIGFVNSEILNKFIHNFFPDSNLNIDIINIRPEITVAMLQNMILEGYDAKQIVEQVEDKKLSQVS